MGKQHRIKRTAKQVKNKKPPPPKTTADYRIAVAAYENEDYNGALKAIQNFHSVNKNTVFYHHAEAFLQYKLATQNEDFATVRNHIKEAAISARRAADLCGNSIILGHFCASMHYILACLNDNYDGVIQECERTLAIKDAKKPDRDSFIFKDLSQEMKIKKINQELTEMIKQCRNKKRWVPVDSKKRFLEFMSEIKYRVLETNNRLKSASESVSLLPKVEDRRKKQALDNVMSNFVKQQKLKSFWSKMCPKEKGKLFEVSTEDLKTHLHSLKGHKAMDHVLEALDFYRTWKTWQFWECFYCYIKFGDWDSYMDHLFDNHGWDIPSDMLSFLPTQVDDVSVEIIEKGDWKPANTDDLIKVMVRRLLFGRKCDKNLSSIGTTGDLKWPSCNDSERTNLLAEVHAMLKLLLRCKCLMQDHIDSLIELTIKELKLRVLDSHFRHVGVKNLKLLCFLGLSQLRSVLQYLQSVADSFGLSENPEIENTMDEQLYNDWDSDLKEKVVLSGDFLYLLLDEQIGELNLADYFDSVASDAGSDKILSQLYTGKEVGKELESWSRIRGNLKGLAEQFFDMFELERLNIVRMSEERLEHGKELSAAEKVESIFAEEIKRREKSPQHVVQTYASLLRKLKMELEERTDNAENNYQCDLDFISNILEKNQTVTAYQLQIMSRVQENLNLSDDCLGKKISLCKDQLSSIVCVDNATIMQSIVVIKQYGLQLGEVSACDYRLIMVPILKSLIQLRLEDLVHKENKENSDANMHALLKELDAEKKINEERNNMRQPQGQSTDNKKEKSKGKKDGAQVNDFKGTESSKKPWLPQKEADQDDYPVLDTGDSITADELQENEVVDKNLGYQMQSPDTMHGSNTLGAGLKNEAGENNCFLNVIIQSLWHLRTFAKKFMSRSKLDHKHVEAACIVCALRDVFYALCKASASDEESVSPTPLRMALSCLYKKRRRFLMGQMNDASYVFEAILSNLHRSFTSSGGSPGSPGSAWGSNCNNSSNPCLVHNIFGMSITIKTNGNHGRSSVHRRNISDFICIRKNEFRKWKVIHGNRTFERLVKLELEAMTKKETQSTIGPNTGDGGKLNYANITDWLPLHVLTIVLEDENDTESQHEISSIYNELSTELDIGVHSQGSDPGKKFILISLVCYHASKQHYSCVIYNYEHQRCFSYDDKYVMDFGNWDSVFKKCIQSDMEPYILIFETVQ